MAAPYPTTALELADALVNDSPANWSTGWLLDEPTEASPEAAFGPVVLGAEAFPELFNVPGLRGVGSSAYRMSEAVGTSSFSMSGFGQTTNTQDFKFALVVKLRSTTASARNVIGYGDTSAGFWRMEWLGTASGTPDRLRLRVFDGVDTATCTLAVPPDEWLVVVGLLNRQLASLRIGAAWVADGELVTATATANATAIGTISSGSNNATWLGASIVGVTGQSAPMDLDALYVGLGTDAANGLAELLEQSVNNLFQYVGRGLGLGLGIEPLALADEAEAVSFTTLTVEDTPRDYVALALARVCSQFRGN